MASAYNPYSDIQKVYNAKVAWNNATTESERKKQNEIATAARNKLAAYGYGDVVEQISAGGADATATRKVLESYAPKETTPTTSGSNSGLIEKNNTEVNNKVNELWGIQTDDHSNTNALWEKEYKDLKKTNPFTTEEAKAILGKYDLSGLQARDNAVASGGSSNGGNIDSYAASNALRQQAALVNQGQMVVLDAHQQKLDNARAILEGMGAYQKDSHTGMQKTIEIQQNEGQRLFENDETAKNNEVARLSEQASVTGYTPNEWVIKNDDIYSQFLNEDGTFKPEKESVDIQALINQAKANGDTETANKLAVVRTKKILGNYGQFGKYSNVGDISSMKPQQTEAGRQFDKNDATVRETLKTESSDTRYGIDTEKDIALAANQNAIDKIKAETEGNKELLTHQAELQGNVSGVLSEDAEKVAKQIQEKINKYANENYGVDVMDYKGRGTYEFTLPKGHVEGWWDDIVIKAVMESPLTTDEKDTLIDQLGFGGYLVEFNNKYTKDSSGKYVSK